MSFRSGTSERDSSLKHQGAEKFARILNLQLRKELARAISTVVKSKVDYQEHENYLRARVSTVSPSDTSSKKLNFSTSKGGDKKGTMRRVVSSKGVDRPEVLLKDSSRQSLALAKNLINIEDEEDKSQESSHKIEALGSAKGTQRMKWFLSSPNKGASTTRIEPKHNLNSSENKNEFHKRTQTEEDKNQAQSSSLTFFNRNFSDPNFEALSKNLHHIKGNSGELRMTQSSVKLESGSQSKKASFDDEEERISYKKSSNAAKRKILQKADKARLRVLKNAFSILKSYIDSHQRKKNDNFHPSLIPPYMPNLVESIPDYEEDLEESFIENLSENEKQEPSRHRKTSGNNMEKIVSNPKSNPYYFHSIIEEQQTSRDNLPSVNKPGSSRGKGTPTKLKSHQSNIEIDQPKNRQENHSPHSSESKKSRKDLRNPNKDLKPSLSLERNSEKLPQIQKSATNHAEKKKVKNRILDHLDDVSSDDLGIRNDSNPDIPLNKKVIFSSSLLKKGIINFEDLKKLPRFANKLDLSGTLSKESKKDKVTLEDQLFDSFILSQKTSLEHKLSRGAKQEFLKQFTEDKLIEPGSQKREGRRQNRKEYNDVFTSKTYLQVIGGLSEINSISKVGHSVKNSTDEVPKNSQKSQNLQYFLHVLHNLFSRNNRRWQRQAFELITEDESEKEVMPLILFSRAYSIGRSPASRDSSIQSRSISTSLMGNDSLLSSVQSIKWKFDNSEVYNVKYLVKCIQWMVYDRKRASFKYLKHVMARSKRAQKSLFNLKDIFEKLRKFRLSSAFHTIQNRSKGAEWELQMKHSQIDKFRILIEKVLNPKLDGLTVGFMKIHQLSQTEVILQSKQRKRNAEFRFLLKILFGIENSHLRYSVYQLKAWADFVGTMKQLGKNSQLKTLVESTQRKVSEMLTSYKKSAKLEMKKMHSKMGLISIISILVRQLSKKSKLAMNLLRKLVEPQEVVEPDTDSLKFDALARLSKLLCLSFESKLRDCLFSLKKHTLLSKLQNQTNNTISGGLSILRNLFLSNRKQRAAEAILKLKDVTFIGEKVSRTLQKLLLIQKSKLRIVFEKLHHSSLLIDRKQFATLQVFIMKLQEKTKTCFSALRTFSLKESSAKMQDWHKSTVYLLQASKAAATIFNALHLKTLCHVAPAFRHLVLFSVSQKLGKIIEDKEKDVAMLTNEALDKENKRKDEFLVMEKMMEEEQKMIEELVKEKTRLEAEVNRLHGSHTEVDEDKDEEIEALEEKVKLLNEMIEKMEADSNAQTEEIKRIKKTEEEEIKWREKKAQQEEEFKKKQEKFIEDQTRYEDEKLKLLASLKEEELKMTKQRENLVKELETFEKEKTDLLSSVKNRELEISSQKESLLEATTNLEAERTKLLASIKDSELKLNKKFEDFEAQKQSFESEKENELTKIHLMENELTTLKESLKADAERFQEEKENQKSILKNQENQLNEIKEQFKVEQAQFETTKNKLLATLKEGEIELEQEKELLKTQQSNVDQERNNLIVQKKNAEEEISKKKQELEEASLILEKKKGEDLAILKEKEEKLLNESESLKHDRVKLEEERTNLLASIKLKELELVQKKEELDEEKFKFEDQRTSLLASIKEKELELSASKDELVLKQSKFEADQETRLAILKESEKALSLDRESLLREKEEYKATRIKDLSSLKEVEISIAKEKATLENLRLEFDLLKKSQEEERLLSSSKLEDQWQSLNKEKAALDEERRNLLADIKVREIDVENLKKQVNMQRIALEQEKEELRIEVNSEKQKFDDEIKAKSAEIREAESLMQKDRKALVVEREEFEARKEKLLASVKEGELELSKQRELFNEEKSKEESEKLSLLGKLKEAELSLSSQKVEFESEKNKFYSEKEKLVGELKAKELDLSKEKEVITKERATLENTKQNLLGSIKQDELAISKEKEVFLSEKNQFESEKIKLLASIKEKELELEKHKVEQLAEKARIQEEKNIMLAKIKEEEIQLSKQKQQLEESRAKFEQEKIELLAAIKTGELDFNRQKQELQLQKVKLDEERVHKMSEIKEAEIELEKQKQLINKESIAINQDRTNLLSTLKEKELEILREKDLLKEEKLQIVADRQHLATLIKESEIEMKKQKELLVDEKARMDEERTRVEKERVIMNQERTKVEKERAIMNEDRSQFEEEKRKIEQQKSTIEEEKTRMEDEKYKLLATIKENELVLTKQIEAILDENIKHIGPKQDQKNSSLHSAPSFSKFQESSPLSFANVNSNEPIPHDLHSQPPSQNFFYSSLLESQEKVNENNKNQGIEGNISVKNELQPTNIKILPSTHDSHLSASSALLLSKLFTSKYVVSRSKFLSEICTSLVVTAQCLHLDQREGDLTASFREADNFMPDASIDGVEDYERRRRDARGEDFDDLQIVEKKLTPTNSIRTTKKYDFGKKSKDSEPAESRNLSIYSDKDHLSKEIKELSNFSDTTGNYGEFKYPSIVFEKVHQRIKEINERIDRSQSKKLMINTDNFYLPKSSIPLSNSNTKNPLAFEMGKRSSIPSGTYIGKISSPVSSQKKYSIIEEGLSPNRRDTRENSWLDLHSQDQFVKRHNKLRYDNIVQRAKLSPKVTKLPSDFSEQNLEKLRNVLKPRVSLPEKNSFFFGKTFLNIKPKHGDKRGQLFYRVMMRLTARRKRQVLERMNGEMLAAIAREIPRHSKPIRLMRLAGALKNLFKSKVVDALGQIDAVYQKRYKERLDNKPTQGNNQSHLDHRKGNNDVNLGTERRKEARSHLDALLSEVKNNGIGSLCTEKPNGSRKFQGMKGKDSETVRDNETKALEYEIGVISRLRSFQKLEYFSKAIESILMITAFKRLKSETMN